MTTNPPDNPPADPPAPSEEPTAPAKAERKGYAVFDTRYLRFLPGVHEKKPSKADAKKAVGHDDFEIREV